MSDDELEPSRLWATLIDGLAAEARGEPVDDDAVSEAATILAAATLVRFGLSWESVERLFVEREHDIKVSYDGGAEEFGITIDWRNGDDCWRCDSAKAETPAGLCAPCHQDLV